MEEVRRVYNGERTSKIPAAQLAPLFALLFLLLLQERKLELHANAVAINLLAYM